MLSRLLEGPAARGLVALLVTLLLAPALTAAQTTQGGGSAFLPEELEQIAAPIALYPDPLVAQVLMASTYPLEIVEVGQWLKRNSNLQGSKLVDAAREQKWDPSIQALVVFPDVIKRLNADIRWTTDLGNAFLSQQADVMNAVQRMRAGRGFATGEFG